MKLLQNGWFIAFNSTIFHVAVDDGTFCLLPNYLESKCAVKSNHRIVTWKPDELKLQVYIQLRDDSAALNFTLNEICVSRPCLPCRMNRLLYVFCRHLWLWFFNFFGFCERNRCMENISAKIRFMIDRISVMWKNLFEGKFCDCQKSIFLNQFWWN